MKQIYFLEWLAKESGFSESALLKQMLPKYQKWNDLTPLSFKEIIAHSKYNWLGSSFNWERSFLKPSFKFWEEIDIKWRNLLKEISLEDYKNIKFSKKSIKEYLNKNKTKILKLKRL
jgi:hypothetical protein